MKVTFFGSQINIQQILVRYLLCSNYCSKGRDKGAFTHEDNKFIITSKRVKTVMKTKDSTKTKPLVTATIH